MKEIEIPNIAQWEETDSILAKNTIGRLENEVRTAYDRGYCDCSRHDRDDLERKHQQLEHIEQVNKKLYERIDKAIETLEKRIEENEEIDYVDMTGKSYINYQKEIIDILRGKDKPKYLGYSDKECINCGRERVEKYSDGTEICEKCNFDQNKKEYVLRGE